MTDHNDISSFWDKRWALGQTVRLDEADKARAMLAVLPDRIESLLDVGCGTGWMLRQLRARCAHLVGVDPSRVALRQVDSADARLVASGASLPFSDASFEVVISTEVLEHYKEEALLSAAHELARVSARYVFVTVPFEEQRLANMVRCDRCLTEFHSSLHMRAFSEATLRELFQPTGLVVKRSFTTGAAPRRSELLARLNSALTGYHSYWSPGLICPVCNHTDIKRQRARDNPLSLVFEGLNALIGKLTSPRPHNLCILFERPQR